MTTFVKSIRNRLGAFRSEQDGNVATMFALAIIPIIGFTGAAIDYSRASSVRAAMQAALDATALAMSKEAGTVTQQQAADGCSGVFHRGLQPAGRAEIQIMWPIRAAAVAQLTITGKGSIKRNSWGSWGSTISRCRLRHRRPGA